MLKRMENKRSLPLNSKRAKANAANMVVTSVPNVEITPTTRVFLKNGIHVASIEELYNLRDAINDAINKYEENAQDQEQWEN